MYSFVINNYPYPYPYPYNGLKHFHKTCHEIFIPNPRTISLFPLKRSNLYFNCKGINLWKWLPAVPRQIN